MMCIVSGSFGGGPQKVSTEDQVAAITTSLEDAESWLYDEGESTTLQAYVAKYNDVKAVADVVLVPLDLLQNPPPPPGVVAANATGNGTDVANGTSTELPEGGVNGTASTGDAEGSGDADSGAGDSSSDSGDADAVRRG